MGIFSCFHVYYHFHLCWQCVLADWRIKRWFGIWREPFILTLGLKTQLIASPLRCRGCWENDESSEKPLLSWYLFPCFLAAELSFCVSRGTCYFQEFDVWRVFEIITAVHFVHNYSEEQALYCDPNCSSSAKTRPCASFQETRTCSCTWEHYVNS